MIVSFPLPRLALSVRQPWAYALAMGWKPVENRSWRVITASRRHIGAFCIHASKGMTRDEYEDAAAFFQQLGYRCPFPDELQRGGIVGVGRVTGIVKQCDSEWFSGPKGIVIADAQCVDFVPCPGQLDFFEWHAAGEQEHPRPWMLKWGRTDASAIEARQGTLL